MPRGHLFAVCFKSCDGCAEMPNGLALSLVAGKTAGIRRMRSQAASVPLGAVQGLGADGKHKEQGRGGRILRGE